jgi:hypothetical protein
MNVSKLLITDVRSLEINWVRGRGVGRNEPRAAEALQLSLFGARVQSEKTM